MSFFWYGQTGIIHGDTGILLCPTCPCVGEVIPEPPEGWCAEYIENVPESAAFPIRISVPSLVDFTQTLTGDVFDVVTVGNRQIILETVNDGTTMFALATFQFNMRIPYLYVSRLYIEFESICERISGTSHASFLNGISSQFDLGTGLAIQRNRGVIGGVAATTFSSGEANLNCEIEEPEDNCPFIWDIEYIHAPGLNVGTGAVPATEAANNNICLTSCDLRFAFSCQHTHGAPVNAGARFRSTHNFAFAIEGTNTPPAPCP